jgi:hypothetical protein
MTALPVQLRPAGINRRARQRPAALQPRALLVEGRHRGSIIYVSQERVVYLSELYFAEQFLWTNDGYGLD